MRVKFLTIVLILVFSLLTACSATQATQETNPGSSADPTEVVSAETAKEAYPAADVPATGAYPAAEVIAVDLGSYPAPDPNTGVIAALPVTARYQNAEIDGILDVFIGDKGAELPARIAYSQFACTKAEGLGGAPKCADGEAEGTQLEVLPSLGAEGSFLRKNDENLKNLPGKVELLGAFKVKADYQGDEFYPSGAYGIVVRVKGDNSQVITLRVTANGIVRVDYLPAPTSMNDPDVEAYLDIAK